MRLVQDGLGALQIRRLQVAVVEVEVMGGEVRKFGKGKGNNASHTIRVRRSGARLLFNSGLHSSLRCRDNVMVEPHHTCSVLKIWPECPPPQPRSSKTTQTRQSLDSSGFLLALVFIAITRVTLHHPAGAEVSAALVDKVSSFALVHFMLICFGVV